MTHEAKSLGEPANIGTPDQSGGGVAGDGSSRSTVVRPVGFDANAAKEYAKSVEDYVVYLEHMTRKIAAGAREDISGSHVRQAVDALGAVSRRPGRLCDLALLLVGASLGYFGNVILAEAYTFANAPIFMLPLAVGSALYAYGANRS